MPDNIIIAKIFIFQNESLAKNIFVRWIRSKATIDNGQYVVHMLSSEFQSC